MKLFFKSMLETLKSVPGYQDYLKFLNTRQDNFDYEAEIIALYEINKIEHPLIKISSQEDNKPEGLISFGSSPGFIEAAYIRDPMSSNENREGIINQLKKYFSSLCLKPSSNDCQIMVIIKDRSELLCEEDYIELKRLFLNELSKNCKDFYVSQKGIVLHYYSPNNIILSPNNSFNPVSIKINMSEYVDFDAAILFQSGGIIIYSNPTTDLVKKILSNLHKKRSQFCSSDYQNYLHVYYFFVESLSPPRMESAFREYMPRIGEARNNEIIIVSSLFFNEQHILKQWKKFCAVSEIRQKINLSNLILENNIMGFEYM
ncbi:MAG: hypothetical protein WC666_02700 [Candidatus Paceibacterota bacterium]